MNTIELKKKYQEEFAQMNRPYESDTFVCGYSKLEDATLRMMPIAARFVERVYEEKGLAGLNGENIHQLIAAYALDLAVSALEAANQTL